MDGIEDSRVTARPPEGDTVRPGGGGMSLEEYLDLVGSTRPPPLLLEEEMSLDELIGAILDRHEREAALLDVLDDGWNGL